MSKDLISLNLRRPLLTISLLTSNRKDTIRKCLDSITHLRETVSSELIIVDTGCDKEMQSIIREYTDHIIRFTWCNDFARARNTGLFEAKGEWFMYLDDDEWFEDTSEIERFFKKGYYKDFDACFYIQRNYTDMTGLSYSDDPVSRMMKLTPEVKFVGCIHEYLDPFQGIYTTVKSYVHHYGYVFKSEEEKYRHSMRNLSLLKKVIKEEPGQIRWWLQIAQEYNAISEYDRMHDFCEEGLTVFTKERTGDDRFLRRDVAGLYLGMLEADLKTFKFEQCIEEGKLALEDKRLWPMAIATVYLDMAKAYEKLGKYDDMRESCLAYLSIYDDMHDDEKSIMEQTCFMVDETFTQKYHEFACWMMAKDAMSRDDIAQLRKYFEMIVWDQKALFVYDKETVLDIIRCLARNEFDIWFIVAATNIASRSDHIKKCCRLIYEYEEKEDKTEFNRLVRIFSYIDIHTYYLDYLKVLALNVDGAKKMNDDVLYDTVKRTFGEVSDFLSFKKEYWELLKERNINIFGLFMGTPMHTWMLGVDAFCDKAEIQEIEYISILIDTIVYANHGDIRFDYFTMRAGEAKISKSEESFDYHELKDKLKAYAAVVISFYKKLYRDEVFQNIPEALPDDGRLAVLLENGFAAENAGDYKEALMSYKEAIGKRNCMNDTVQSYSHLYADRVKESLPKEEAILGNIDEKTALGWQIRLKAKRLKEMGYADEAAKILEQLETLEEM